MAFVLTAKLNLLGPDNVKLIASQIRRDLNAVSNVGLNLVAPTNTKSIVNQINKDLQKVNKNIRINVNSKTMTTSIERIRQATGATKELSKGVESLGYQTARSIRHYAGFALTTSSVIKLAAAFSAGIGDAIKYDRELVRISQVTGQSVSGLKDLSKEVTRLSTSFGVSSEKILESAVTLSQAGLSANDTRIALEALAKTGLSATFGDIKGTTEATIAIMQQFGYQAKDLESILGSVNAVSAAFAVESEDIAVAVRRSGGALQAAGVNFHEFSALLTSVRQTTRESAESIATGFRTIFARLQRSRTQDFLKNLGIDVLNDDGLFVGGYEAIRRISTALKDISTVDPRFSQIVEELGGFRQVSKVIPLIEKFDVAEKALNVSLRGGNSLTKDAVAAQQSLEVQFTKTREAFLGLIREIIADDGFRNLIRMALETANAFIKVADSLKGVIPLIGALSFAKFIPKLPSYQSGFIKGLAGEKPGGERRFAKGGFVPGTGNGDTVPALLTPGEFVIKKSSAKAIGYDRLNKMNKYASGGKVIGGRKLSRHLIDSSYVPNVMQEDSLRKSYGNRGYRLINGKLRGNVKDDEMMGGKRFVEEDIHNLDTLISNSVLNRDVTVFRGIDIKGLENIEKSIKTSLDSPKAIGGIFVDKGFVSASTDIGVSNTFGSKRILRIKAKKGQHAIEGNREESEIIFPRDSAFRILSSNLMELINPTSSGIKQNRKFSRYQEKYMINVPRFAAGGKVGLKYPKLGSLNTNLLNTYDPISQDEHMSVNDYGTMGYYQINGLLRGSVGKRSGPGVESLINRQDFIRRAKDINNIDKIITKSVINRDATLYRGVEDNGLKAIEQSIGTRLDSPDAAGRIFVDKGFVSTSIDKNVGRGFGELGNLFHIKVKKGQRATRVIPHGDRSEKEILLPRNSAFKVIRKRLLELVNPVFPVAPINNKQSEAQSRFGRTIRRNSGGAIPGQGDSDSVPSLLTPGEFVINKKAAKNIGYATLNNMNRHGKVRRYNKGGLVGKAISSVKDNPVGALALVTTGVTVLSNLVEGTNDTFKQLSQAALNLTVQFGIASTILTQGGDFLNSQLTKNPSIDKYTKVGRDNAQLDREKNAKSAPGFVASTARGKKLNELLITKQALEEEKRIDIAIPETDLEANRSEAKRKARAATQKYVADREAIGIKTSGKETLEYREKKFRSYESEGVNNLTTSRMTTKTREGELSINDSIARQKAARSARRIASKGASPEEALAHQKRRYEYYKSKGETSIRENRSEGFTNIRKYARDDGNLSSERSQILDSYAGDQRFADERGRKARAKQTLNRIGRIKLSRGTAIGGAIAGVAGNMVGGYLQNKGTEEIAAGGTSTTKSTVGGAISGASSYGALGAQIGAVGGAPGVVIGAAVGALVGALKGGTDALAEAEKQIRAVRLDKSLVNLGRKLNAIANGTSSSRDSAVDISSSISSAFKDISPLQGTERTDAISKFKNNSSAIEGFYNDIAKNSSSLEEFNKVTGNSLIQFAAISDIGFTELVTSVNNTIKAEIKAKEALDKMNAAAAITADSQAVLEAFVTAIASATNSLTTFDTNLDRIEAGINFTGASAKSQSAQSVFKAAAGGRFLDSNKVSDISNNLMSQFGGVGQTVATQTGDIAKARQLVPDIIKEFANAPFSEDRTPQSLARKRLEAEGIGPGVIDQVLAGITNTIGNESNQANLAKKFAANPNDTANDIFKTLTPTIEAMGDFANKVSEHNNRIGRLFELSSKIQAKVNGMKLEESEKIRDLIEKFREDSGEILSPFSARQYDDTKIGMISGSVQNNSVSELLDRATAAKDGIAKSDEIISERELAGLNVDTELAARQKNVDILERSTAALTEMTKNGREYAAVEKALAKAGNERRFRKDSLNLQGFGSVEDKNKEAKTQATIIALANDQLSLSQLNDEGKASVDNFLTQNEDVQFAGLNNQDGKDLRKKFLIKDQAQKLQQYGGLSEDEALAKAKENVEQAFEKTKEEGRLQQELIGLVKGQGEASAALQRLLEMDDPLKTNMLAKENTRFLSELGAILTNNLINQEKTKKEQADAVLDKAKVAEGLPSIEDIQNAQTAAQINNDIKTKTEGVLTAKKLKVNTLEEGINAIKNNKEYQFGDSGALNSKGQDAVNALSQQVLGPSHQDDLFIGSETGQRSFSLDAATDKIKNRLQESSATELNNTVNPIINRRQGLRPVDPSLQGKTPAEIQDMLDRKKAAPSEAEVRGAKLQSETSERSIRALQNGTPLSSVAPPQQSLVQRAIGASQGFGTEGQSVASVQDKMRGFMSSMPPSVISRVNALAPTPGLDNTLSSIGQKPSKLISGADPAVAQSISKITEAKDGLVGIMNSSVNGLNSFASTFQSTIDKLSGVEMSLTGTHKVEVIFNGAEILSKLTPEIEAMVVGRTKEAINKFTKDNFPNIPEQV